MRLDTEFVRLPLRTDPDRLSVEVSQFVEGDWRPHPQGHPGNSALPLIAAAGDPANDATRGAMRRTPHLARCPYLMQVLAALDAPLGRTRLMRLDGNAEATAHTDTNYYWLHHARIHIPIVTTPDVRFLCGERAVNMAAGEIWVFDTWKPHNVLNPQPTRRVHLVADSVGSSAFWDLVAAGERPFDAGARPPAPDREITFDPAITAAIRTESVNQPVVMSPFEQRVLLDGLLRDLEMSDSPQAPAGLVAAFRAELQRFQRDWHAAWAEHGEDSAGWAAYREQLEALQRRLAPYERRLRLPNRVDAVEAVRQMVVRPGLNSERARDGGPTSPTPPEDAGVQGAPDAVPAAASAAAIVRPRRVDRPVFIVSSPRSGSTLLFETLAKSPSVWTIGGESHAVIEGIPALHPSARGFDSNALDATDATPAIVERLTEAFVTQLVNRDARQAAAEGPPIRLLEKTPKNSLRIPFLLAAFPDARFVYLYREPRETLSSMLDAWKSRRFVTYPNLPDWPGPPWSLLLVPGWRQLAGEPLADIVIEQWTVATRQLLDDLEQLAPDRWCVASYDRLVEEPQAEVTRLCAFLDLDWDHELTAPLPLARHTLTPPDRDKWRRNMPELAPYIHLIEETAARARAVFGHQPPPRPARRRAAGPEVLQPAGPSVPGPQAAAPAPAPAAQASRAPEAAGDAFRSIHTGSLPRLLAQAAGSVLVSTYQSGRVITLRLDEGRLNTHFKFFPSPMGMALGPKGLLIGTQRGVWHYQNQPAAVEQLPGQQKHDACFLPRRYHTTGDIRIHEVAWCGDEAWIVNTRFSCLATLDDRHSFVPRWRPSFITDLAAEDRCHLNGMAVIDGRPKYVTALGTTDVAQGWRERKADGGVIIDVDSGEVVSRGLSMPHSPRWYQDRLWVLESGKGELNTVDLKTGRSEMVAQMPGFTRGLAFAGPLAFIGLSQVRESVFGGIPLAQRLTERACGVWVIDIRSGNAVGFLRFEGAVQEVFDLLMLPRMIFPELVEPDEKIVASTYSVPGDILAAWKTGAAAKS